jgi:hypothetical protein
MPGDGFLVLRTTGGREPPMPSVGCGKGKPVSRYAETNRPPQHDAGRICTVCGYTVLSMYNRLDTCNPCREREPRDPLSPVDHPRVRNGGNDHARGRPATGLGGDDTRGKRLELAAPRLDHAPGPVDLKEG